ncbi:MATE family efflux transporter [Parvularcula sp. ZS-1/3]|uniref:MATE family efflux transporter n=1 Tax=Parvularcula mediterranea TaxID=2732508 RepID=A0A7Y3RM83_9PROT|nr:MATE family efflux transporter [Parvularcula mediterranea]NNU16594.1 MATE family efflux transporter [Parvularcula mediterranea]
MSSAAPQPATLRSAFAIAWPASLAAIITPVLGLTDVAVLARGAEAEALAGASLAGAVFSLLYWSFSFLRMSLSGLVAQALGADDEGMLRARLVQGALFGFAVGLLLLILQAPIIAGAQLFLVDTSEASAAAGDAMRSYIGIRIWGAPAVITTTALLGWFTGQGRTGLLMAVTIGTASVNAVLSILFVLVFGWGIEGLALATALAELSGLLIGLGGAAWVLAQRGGVLAHWSRARMRDGLGALLSLNGDIFVRTLLLDSIFVSFARFGADFGDVTLAANHVLLNLVLALTLFLDGPAIAAETYVGQAVGSKTRREELFSAAWRETAKIAGAMALALFLLLVLFGDLLLSLTVGEGSDTAAVLAEAKRFLPWAVLMPLATAAAYHLDGIYIGATRGAALRNTMAVATALYFAAVFLLREPLGNHGLWAAFVLFMAARGVLLVLTWRGFRPLLSNASSG